MTRGAALQLRHTLNLVFRRQFFADLRLIRRSLPIHIENLIAWPQNLLWIAMAVQTPLHQQRRGLKHQRHLVDLTVTRRASHALIDVNAVVEIDVVRQAVHADPLYGFIGAITFAHRLQISGVVEQDGMAIHARLGGRNPSGGGGFDAGMTVPAVDTVVSNVVFMAELDRLLARNVLIRQIGSAGQTHHAAKGQSSEQRAKKDTDLGDKIRTAVKNLGHVNFALVR
jgi:hypothetical protein